MSNKLKNTIESLINQNSNKIDAENRSKLNQARQKALQASSRKSFFSTFAFIPAAALLVLGLYFTLPQLKQSPSNIPMNDDLAVIKQLDEIEIIEQIDLIDDIEFYQWLSEDDVQI